MDFIRKMSEMDLWYVPIIALVVLLLMGFWIGVWRGWKLALYYLTWNVVGYLVALFVLDSIYESQLKTLANNLAKDVTDKIGTEALDKTLTLFKGWIVLMLTLVVLAVWNFLAWLVHFFFRKHLKLQKVEGKSNVKARIIGGVFGVVTAIPGTLAFVGATSISVNNKGVSKFIDGATSAITFGKTTSISEDWDAIYGLVLSADHVADIINVFQGQTVDDAKINTVADSITNILNNSKSAEIALSIITKDNPTINVDQIKSQTNFAGILSGLTTQGKTELASILSKLTPTSTGVSDIVSFLTTK